MTSTEPVGLTGPHVIETALRVALTNDRVKKDLLEATGWDSTMPGKVLKRESGITIDKLDAMCRVLGLTIVEVSYMDYLARGNEIGSRCCKARLSMGNCGAR